jgi:hypothetical protein
MESALVELADERLSQAFEGKPLRQLARAQPRPDVAAEREGGVEDVAIDGHSPLAHDRPEEGGPGGEEEERAGGEAAS